MANSSQYIVLKSRGLDFVEVWFGAPRCVPPNLTRMYQLLLHLVTMKGVVPVRLAFSIGYNSRIIGQAVRRGYVELSSAPQKVSRETADRIAKMIGEPPREMVT